MNLHKLFRVNIPYKILKSLENKQESTKLVNNLFWGFNSLLILVLILNELFGDFFIPVISHLIKGYSFTTSSAYSILLYLVPIFALFIRAKLNGKPVLKLQFLFGIEIPILIMVIIRQEMLYKLNMSLKYLFLLFFLMILLYFIKFFFQRNETNRILLYTMKLRKLLLFAFAIFFSVLFIGSSILLGLILLKNSLDLSFLEKVSLPGYVALNTIIVAILLLVLPPVIFAFKFSIKRFRYLVYNLNIKAKATYLFSIIILFSALYFLNIQSKDYTYLLLGSEPSVVKQKEIFFNNIDKIDKELHQTASIRHYYLGSLQNNFLCEMSEEGLELNNTQKKLVQSAYNIFMYPFFYQDTGKVDYEVEYEAEKLYEQLFDKPINEYNYDNYFSFSNENVHIDKQEIDIKEYGDIAEIQICETYSTNSDFSEL